MHEIRKKKEEKEGKEQKKKQKKIQNGKTYHGNISFGNMAKVQNLKPSQLGRQGSVFDDTGGVEMFSPRCIVLGGRDWKRLHKKDYIAQGYFIYKYAKRAKLKTFTTRHTRARFR